MISEFKFIESDIQLEFWMFLLPNKNLSFIQLGLPEISCLATLVLEKFRLVKKVLEEGGLLLM